MEVYRLGFSFLGYGVLGGIAYGADLRWGVGVRGFCLNLIAPEPSEHTEGFLVGRDRSVQFFWSAAISVSTAVAVLMSGAGIWYWQLPLAAAGSVACLGGMRLTPLCLRGLQRVGLVASEPAKLIESLDGAVPAAEANPEVETVSEEPTPVPDEPPPQAPTETELRQQKIDRMDELLGKKKGN